MKRTAECCEQLAMKMVNIRAENSAPCWSTISASKWFLREWSIYINILPHFCRNVWQCFHVHWIRSVRRIVEVSWANPGDFLLMFALVFAVQLWCPVLFLCSLKVPAEIWTKFSERLQLSPKTQHPPSASNFSLYFSSRYCP